MRLYQLTLLFVATVIVSCSTVEDDPTLEGIEWFLVSETALDGSDASIWDTDEIYSVQFMADSVFLATIDCNDCTGSYSTGIRGQLAVQVRGCTEVACIPPSYDRRFKQVFHAADSFQLEIDELKIFSTYEDSVRILILRQSERSP